MTDVLDPASMIEAAQQAAGAGDFPTAERLLREAAALQEAALGAEHPDLATTLNNLAFVCERTNNIVDAERNYRRAHAIAVASLGPRHPFVATSVKNLVDFCAAHDIPIWKPPAAASDDETPDDDFAVEPEPEVAEVQFAQSETDPEWDVNVPQERVHAVGWPTPRMIGLAGLGAVVIVAIVFMVREWETAAPNDPPPVASTAAAQTRDTQPTVTAEAKADAKPAVAERPAANVTVEQPAARESGTRPVTNAKTVASQSVTVLNAQLCKTLVKRGSPDWQCVPASGDLRPGTYTFYTRLLTDKGTTVEHRWLGDGRAYLVMRLRVSPVPNGGYRTFSSNTIRIERAGNWRVELRAADGTVLREERFVVK